MTRARNIANPTQITIPLDVSANITSNAVISVGNTEVNTLITETTIVVGNSSVNTVIHSTGITANGANIHSINASSISSGTLDTARLPANVSISTNLNVAGNTLVANSTAVVVNEGGNDVDFRVESDTDANLLFVDASADAVGIGKNSPGAKLDVSGSATLVARFTTSGAGSYGALHVVNTTADNEASIGFRDSSDSDAQSWVIGKSVGFAGNHFAFYYGATRMVIDTSGRVTIPYQPYFYVIGTAGGTLYTNTVIPFNNAIVNTGNHFNTSTYVFTAPIAGRYLFTTSILNYPNSTNAGELSFSVNNGSYNPLFRHNGIGSQVSITGSAILSLAANDTVGVRGTIEAYMVSGHAHFSGMLLG